MYIPTCLLCEGSQARSMMRQLIDQRRQTQDLFRRGSGVRIPPPRTIKSGFLMIALLRKLTILQLPLEYPLLSTATAIFLS